MASKTAAAGKRNTNPDFDAAYIELRNILAKHARQLNVVNDDANTYCVESKKPMYKSHPMMSGGVMKKAQPSSGLHVLHS